MRVHWEKLEILGPVYRLVGRGFGDDEIAGKLNISEHNVRQCVAWLMRFSEYSSRAELVLEAFAAIPLDGEHRFTPAMAGFGGVDVGIPRGKLKRWLAQPGTVLLREGFLLPDSAQIETFNYSSTWCVLAEVDTSKLASRLSLAGLHLFFVAGELKVVQLGWGAGAVRRGIKRILALSCKESLNCAEITRITPAHFLGVPYVAILAHSFHIQKGIVLHSSIERRSEQTQRDWACG
jgi:hypothetical protein